MFSTLFLLLVMLLLLGVSLLLWGYFLRVGLRWRKVPNVTLRKVILATILAQVLCVLILAGSRFLHEKTPAQALFAGLVELLLCLVFSWFIVARIFKTRFSQTLLAWLPTLISSGLMLLFVLLALIPYVSEGYTIVANSMAPTLLGEYGEVVCPICHEPAYYSLPWATNWGKPRATDRVKMICENFHVTRGEPRGSEIHYRDRILVAKFLKPRRWQLVVFHYPADPTMNYVKRLVGLPGETIIIKEGAVYADGQKLTPPPELQGIEYLSVLPGPGAEHIPALWGTEERPAKLGEGEYFMLGDYSASSKDSRLWSEGAPGHPPYAVPEDLMIGVATHCYWPPNRIRVFP